MFKLVIVEDEDNIRHSLECFIPWQEMGFQVVGAFSDGSDALAYLMDNSCDVVLTDILMSRMSGLEMIQQLHEIWPATKVVILSGHSDFAYAQQAIRFQVTHYLVKPVDEEELMDVFRQLKDQMEAETAEQSLAETETRELRQMLMKNFFRDLLSGNISAEQELTECLKLLGMRENQTQFGLLAYEICDNSGGGEPIPESMQCDLLGIVDVNANCLCYENKPGQMQLVVLGDGRMDDSALRQYGNELLGEVVTTLNGGLSGTYVGRLTHHVLQLTDLLATANGQTETHDQTNDIEMADYRLLTVELDLGCLDTTVRILERFIHEMAGLSAEDTQARLKQLYAAVEQDYRKRKIDVREITNGRFHGGRLFHTTAQEELLASAKEDFQVLCRSLQHTSHRSEHTVIDRIVRYLEQNPDEDISHDAIAAKYRIHPGYLSRLFKQEMGENLSEYLLRIKIERAAQLLKEDRYKIGEIAKMVGYSTSSYFSVMFKKYTGCTPREYCQRVSP